MVETPAQILEAYVLEKRAAKQHSCCAKGDVMFCPLCRKTANPAPSPNGGHLYVAEDMDTCTECYEPDIEPFECDKCKVAFYLSVKKRKNKRLSPGPQHDLL